MTSQKEDASKKMSRIGGSNKKRMDLVNFNSPMKAPILANTPSAKSVRDATLPSPNRLYSQMPANNIQSVATLNTVADHTAILDQNSMAGSVVTDPQHVAKHLVSNDVKHEIFLKDEQIEFNKIMNKDEHMRRQQQIVKEQGRDLLEEMETDLAQ